MSTKIENLKILGAKLLTAPVFRDQRGAFEVFWEYDDLIKEGISFSPSNSHHSYNERSGTIRAFHFQRPPHEQSKLVSCVRGKVWDVILDLRPDSPTFLQWQGVELSSATGKTIYIPAGCAHGFATLEDCTTIAYLIEGQYHPESSEVIRWSDRELGINWPVYEPILSYKDEQASGLAAYLSSL